MPNVLITGFKTDKAAKEFISWYEAQGEQDIKVWFDDRNLSSPCVDCSKTYPIKKDTDGNFLMILN